MPELSTQAIDLACLPEAYLWAYDNNITLSSDIKGSRLKALYERAILNGVAGFGNSLIAEPKLTSEEILECLRLKVEYFESILGKAKELSPQQQDEFESKFHNAVRMRKWLD
jgi:hypothetical protein